MSIKAEFPEEGLSWRIHSLQPHNKRLSLEQKSETRGVKGMENKQAEGYNNVYQVGTQKETNDFYFYDLSKNFSEIRCVGAHLNPSI